MAEPQPVLSLRGVGKSYLGPQRRQVFAGVDLDLAAGDYVAVMGESGSGKSSLLNLIAGLDRADGGSIRMDGVELTAGDDDARTLLRRERMGFVFQAFHLLAYLNVRQNLALPLALLGMDAEQTATRVAAMLERLGLAARAADLPRNLSGGEQQRVAIGRALIHRPRLVLADEPTGNLDPDSARMVLDLLREGVKRDAGAGILVTHSPLAAAMADRVLVLTREGLREQVPASA